MVIQPPTKTGSSSWLGNKWATIGVGDTIILGLGGWGFPLLRLGNFSSQPNVTGEATIPPPGLTTKSNNGGHTTTCLGFWAQQCLGNGGTGWGQGCGVGVGESGKAGGSTTHWGSCLGHPASHWHPISYHCSRLGIVQCPNVK